MSHVDELLLPEPTPEEMKKIHRQRLEVLEKMEKRRWRFEVINEMERKFKWRESWENSVVCSDLGEYRHIIVGYCHYDAHPGYVDFYQFVEKNCWECFHFEWCRDSEILPLEALAEYHNVTVDTIRRWIKEGHIEGILVRKTRGAGIEAAHNLHYMKWFVYLPRKKAIEVWRVYKGRKWKESIETPKEV